MRDRKRIEDMIAKGVFRQGNRLNFWGMTSVV